MAAPSDGWGGALAEVVSKALSGATLGGSTDSPVRGVERPFDATLTTLGHYLVRPEGFTISEVDEGQPEVTGGYGATVTESVEVSLCVSPDSYRGPRITIWPAVRLARDAAVKAGWRDVSPPVGSAVEWTRESQSKTAVVAQFMIQGWTFVGFQP